jgi:acetyl esterase/lipase
VYTEVFTPAAGIAPRNAKRVLINVHGGGFDGGSRTLSHLESIPIASVGGIKVISIDYRLGPEYTFPAASEDVAAVYRELLESYDSANIGLYGCSAGGALTAQAIAWFQQERLPLPGAIGMFCMGAPRALDGENGEWLRGDAGAIATATSDLRYGQRKPLSYYREVDRHTPVASPGDYDEVMARFPPSLLISGVRDFSLSSVVVTHAQLVRLGVKAQLHVWEGMEHGFHVDHPALPESREAYAVIVGFFDTHLGQ